MIASKKEYILEYRAKSIRVARVSSLTAPVVVEEIVEFSFEEEGDIAAKIRKFAGAKASGYLAGACAIYPESRVLRRVQLDASKGKEVEHIFDLLRRESKIEPDESVIYCLSCGDGLEVDPANFNKKSVLVCGATRSDIIEAQDSLLEKGVYPSRVEVGTVGLLGLLKDSLKLLQSTQPLLLLEVEEYYAHAFIIGENGIEMSRRVECGTKEIATALREEMNLKDDAAAERLLASQQFDFGPMAGRILRRLLRELQSSIGFFEVQTGQSVSRIHSVCHHADTLWLQKSLGELLKLENLRFDFAELLESKGVTLSENCKVGLMDLSWLSLMSLICPYGKEAA